MSKRIDFLLWLNILLITIHLSGGFMPYSIITHKNKEVLFVNHRGLSGDDLLKSFKECNKYLLEQKKEMIAVSDFTDSTMPAELNDYIKSAENKEATRYLKKTGVVGIMGIKKMVLGIYNKLTGSTAKMFNSVEEALDYVIKD